MKEGREGVYCIFSFHRGNTRMWERGIFINVLYTEIIFTFIFSINLLTNYPPHYPSLSSLLHKEEKGSIKRKKTMRRMKRMKRKKRMKRMKRMRRM